MKDKLPSTGLYIKYLNIASLKFNKSLDECRDSFGLLTVREWEETLSAL